MTDLLVGPTQDMNISLITGSSHFELINRVAQRQSAVRRGESDEPALVLVPRDLEKVVLPDLWDHAQVCGGDVVKVQKADHLETVTTPNIGVLVVGNALALHPDFPISQY